MPTTRSSHLSSRAACDSTLGRGSLFGIQRTVPWPYWHSRLTAPLHCAFRERRFRPAILPPPPPPSPSAQPPSLSFSSTSDLLSPHSHSELRRRGIHQSGSGALKQTVITAGARVDSGFVFVLGRFADLSVKHGPSEKKKKNLPELLFL